MMQKDLESENRELRALLAARDEFIALRLSGLATERINAIAHQFQDVKAWAMSVGFVALDEGPADGEQLLRWLLPQLQGA